MSPTGRAAPHLVLIVAVITTVISVALCAAAILTPAPAAAVPLVAAICVGGPLFAAWEAPIALAALRARRNGTQAVSMLRRSLDQLPETGHPLGL